ncbi:MAG: hypothetical protein N2559_15145 [Anaerolineae bacterium]|nr:hypothetical protein [Anaerolineae bacterium]
MPFKVSDFHDLVELLETHPQWRTQLRRLVLSKDMLALPRIVQELAEAQKRTEEQVRELAAAQQRTEQRLDRLEAVVQELAASVRELAEAQKRTEQRVEELAEAQKRTEQHLARLDYRVSVLEHRIGVSVEEEAADVLLTVLRKKGYRAIGNDYTLALDGEVDVVLPLEDAQGQRVSAVLEAKVRLSGRAVEAWAKRMRDPNFREALSAAGVHAPYLVYVYGMRIDVSAREVAEQFGIGLLSSRGEEVPPASLVEN